MEKTALQAAIQCMNFVYLYIYPKTGSELYQLCYVQTTAIFILLIGSRMTLIVRVSNNADDVATTGIYVKISGALFANGMRSDFCCFAFP
jgi:hypothetical protein